MLLVLNLLSRGVGFLLTTPWGLGVLFIVLLGNVPLILQGGQAFIDWVIAN